MTRCVVGLLVLFRRGPSSRDGEGTRVGRCRAMFPRGRTNPAREREKPRHAGLSRSSCWSWATAARASEGFTKLERRTSCKAGWPKLPPDIRHGESDHPHSTGATRAIVRGGVASASGSDPRRRPPAVHNARPPRRRVQRVGGALRPAAARRRGQASRRAAPPPRLRAGRIRCTSSWCICGRATVLTPAVLGLSACEDATAHRRRRDRTARSGSDERLRGLRAGGARRSWRAELLGQPLLQDRVEQLSWKQCG